MKSHILAVASLFVFTCVAMAKDCKQYDRWLSVVDPTIISNEPKAELELEITQLSEKQTLGVIECLLKNRGRTDKANTLTASRSSRLSQTFDSPSVEVASLYYVSYVFFGNDKFAMAIALENENGDINARKTIRDAYRTYNLWFKEVRRIGLGEARRQKLDPLDGTDVNWY